MSSNLALSQVTEGQSDKSGTINAISGELDAALTDTVTYLITSTNARTLTNTELRRFHFLTIDEDGGDPADAAIVLTLPAIKRGLFAVINDTAFAVTVTIAGQPATAPVVLAAKAILLSSDGVDVQEAGGAGETTFIGLSDTPASINTQKMIVGNAAGTAFEEKNIAYDVGASFAGVPANDEIVSRFVATRAFRLPSGLSGSASHARTAATAETIFDIQVNAVSKGSMTFAIAATTATFSFASDVDLVSGDRLEIVGPAGADATLADIATTLAGIRLLPTIQDPDFASVMVLLGFNGADASTTIIDESSVGRAFTAAGNAQLDTAEKKFGSASLLTDGATDDVESLDAADLELGAGDFTLEGFFRWRTNAATVKTLAAKWRSTGNQRSILMGQDGTANVMNLYLAVSGSVTILQISSAFIPNLNQWYHVATDFDGTTYRLYVGGAVIGTSTTLRNLFNGTAGFTVGGQDDGAFSFDGWSDEVRLTVGVARYRGAFTVPTAAFPRS